MSAAWGGGPGPPGQGGGGYGHPYSGHTAQMVALAWQRSQWQLVSFPWLALPVAGAGRALRALPL